MIIRVHQTDRPFSARRLKDGVESEEEGGGLAKKGLVPEERGYEVPGGLRQLL